MDDKQFFDDYFKGKIVKIPTKNTPIDNYFNDRSKGVLRDTDRDRTPDIIDCDPYDPTIQGRFLGTGYSQARALISRGKSKISGYLGPISPYGGVSTPTKPTPSVPTIPLPPVVTSVKKEVKKVDIKPTPSIPDIPLPPITARDRGLYYGSGGVVRPAPSIETIPPPPIQQESITEKLRKKTYRPTYVETVQEVGKIPIGATEKGLEKYQEKVTVPIGMVVGGKKRQEYTRQQEVITEKAKLVEKAIQEAEQYKPYIQGEEFVGTDEQYQGYINAYNRYEVAYRDLEKAQEKAEKIKPRGARPFVTGLAEGVSLVPSAPLWLYKVGTKVALEPSSVPTDIMDYGKNLEGAFKSEPERTAGQFIGIIGGGKVVSKIKPVKSETIIKGKGTITSQLYRGIGYGTKKGVKPLVGISKYTTKKTIPKGKITETGKVASIGKTPIFKKVNMEAVLKDFTSKSQVTKSVKLKFTRTGKTTLGKYLEEITLMKDYGIGKKVPSKIKTPKDTIRDYFKLSGKEFKRIGGKGEPPIKPKVRGYIEDSALYQVMKGKTPKQKAMKPLKPRGIEITKPKLTVVEEMIKGRFYRAKTGYTKLKIGEVPKYELVLRKHLRSKKVVAKELVKKYKEAPKKAHKTPVKKVSTRKLISEKSDLEIRLDNILKPKKYYTESEFFPSDLIGKPKKPLKYYPGDYGPQLQPQPKTKVRPKRPVKVMERTEFKTLDDLLGKPKTKTVTKTKAETALDNILKTKTRRKTGIEQFDDLLGKPKTKTVTKTKVSKARVPLFRLFTPLGVLEIADVKRVTKPETKPKVKPSTRTDKPKVKPKPATKPSQKVKPVTNILDVPNVLPKTQTKVKTKAPAKDTLTDYFTQPTKKYKKVGKRTGARREPGLLDDVYRTRKYKILPPEELLKELI